MSIPSKSSSAEMFIKSAKKTYFYIGESGIHDSFFLFYLFPRDHRYSMYRMLILFLFIYRYQSLFCKCYGSYKTVMMGVAGGDADELSG